MALGVEDRLDILELAARYNHCLDGGDPQGWADCFTDDGVFDSARSGRVEGRAALVAFAENFAQTRLGIRHWIDNVVVEGHDDHATLRCYLLLWDCRDGSPKPVASADYDDELVRVDGRWRFSRRKVG